MTLQAVGSGHVSMKTPLDRIPVFLKGGSIVPRRQRIRRSASLMTKDPITLLIALDEKVSLTHFILGNCKGRNLSR